MALLHRLRPASFLLALLLAPGLRLTQAQSYALPKPDRTWQYSVPLEPGTERRAYLWIPPQCRRVRGVIFGLQNMLERAIFEDPEIRAAAAASDLAIVLVSPGAWPDKSLSRQPSLDYTSNSAEGIAGVQRVLGKLAAESGYTEIEIVPLLIVAHSAASQFAWGVTRAWPDRVFAFLPIKGYPVDKIADGVPTLKVEQEWAEWGPNRGEVWRKEMQQAASKLPEAASPLFGDFADIGSGHFDWNHDAASVIAMFIQKAAKARLPARAPLDRPVTLKPIAPESGVLVDPETLGTARFRALANGEGDPRHCFWYFDSEMANAVNQFMRARLEKKPAAIDFILDGKPAPLTSNGFAVIAPEFLADGIHFRVHAGPLESSPAKSLYGGAALGHADVPIVYRVSSGALQQTGPDTFMMGARSGGLTRQGQPWEPWIMAYEPGTVDYRSADRPAHILIDIRNKRGTPQTVTFHRIPDVRCGSKSIHISARASSGLPVQLYIESGPASIDGNILTLLPIPPRSRYPVRVIVSAYQWGRVGGHPVQSAGPVTRQFFIRK